MRAAPRTPADGLAASIRGLALDLQVLADDIEASPDAQELLAVAAELIEVARDLHEQAYPASLRELHVLADAGVPKPAAGYVSVFARSQRCSRSEARRRLLGIYVPGDAESAEALGDLSESR